MSRGVGVHVSAGSGLAPAPRPRPPVSTRRRSGRRSQTGAVTAEAAVAIPVLVGVGLGLVWVLAVAVAQIQVVDAAREAARSAARGDDTEARVAAARVAPDGSSVRIRRSGEVVTAVVQAQVRGPGGLFASLPAVTVQWRADAVEEPR